MVPLWILLIVGAYQLGRYGLKSFFGLEPEDRRDAVADKWASRCVAEDKKTTRIPVRVVGSKQFK